MNIFCYVGVEQGINNWSSEFLYQYHSLDPEVVGVEVISAFWGNLTIGTVINLFLIKLFDEKKTIKFFAISSSVIILLALHSYSSFSYIIQNSWLLNFWHMVVDDITRIKLSA